MAKKCIYCAAEISDGSVIDFCERCGKNVWGERMFNAIVQNMEEARKNGDLCHTFIQEIFRAFINIREIIQQFLKRIFTL